MIPTNQVLNKHTDFAALLIRNVIASQTTQHAHPCRRGHMHLRQSRPWAAPPSCCSASASARRSLPPPSWCTCLQQQSTTYRLSLYIFEYYMYYLKINGVYICNYIQQFSLDRTTTPRRRTLHVCFGLHFLELILVVGDHLVPLLQLRLLLFANVL